MKEDLQEQINKLLIDDDFERLNLSLKEPNIFEILSADKRELKHSDFLAWLLNPNENHGLNEIFLQKFIKHIFSDSIIENPTRKLADFVSLDFSNVEVHREWKNIDIFIIMRDDVFCIENKINITDHKKQLEGYRKKIETDFAKKQHKHYIYLSPFGRDSENASEDEKKHWHNLSYEEICEWIESTIEIYEKKIKQRVLSYLKEYVTCVRRKIIMNADINEQARNLYLKYQNAIEFIYANKPDYASKIAENLEEYIESQGFKIATRGSSIVRFTTQKLYEKISSHKLGTAWGNELFLFELDFSGLKKAFLKATVSSCNIKDSDLTNLILTIVRKINNLNLTISNSKELRYYIFYKSKKVDFSVEKILENTSRDRNEKIKDLLDKFLPAINEITKTLEDDLDRGYESQILKEIAKYIKDEKSNSK